MNNKILTKQEERFIEYWEKNSEKEKSLFRQLFFGLPFGLLLGIGVVLMLESGWYQRANMVAYSQSSPWLLVIAIIAIAVFAGVFYKKYRWEMNDQHYKELQVKLRNSNKPSAGATD